MANQEKNKYQSHILVEQIDQFVAYLEVEKFYASTLFLLIKEII